MFCARYRAEFPNDLREHVGSGGVRPPLHLRPLRHVLAVRGPDRRPALRPALRLQHQRGRSRTYNTTHIHLPVSYGFVFTARNIYLADATSSERIQIKALLGSQI